MLDLDFFWTLDFHGCKFIHTVDNTCVFHTSLRPSSSPSPLTSSPAWCISTCTVSMAPCTASLITHSHTSTSVTSRTAQGRSTRSMTAFRWKSAGNQRIQDSHLLSDQSGFFRLIHILFRLTSGSYLWCSSIFIFGSSILIQI